MDQNSDYYQQLQLINQMLEQTPEGPERDELISLKHSIEELLSLTEDHTNGASPGEGISTDSQDNQKSINVKDEFDDEYALFMAEMSKEGAIEIPNENQEDKPPDECPELNYKELEGKKFRAPHKHHWGQLAYYNAMVCSVPQDIADVNELQVKVLFLNPTHREMLPCPYYFDLERDCHFSEEECRYSHGELVPYSSLQEYIEPKFESLTIGSEVLAKQSDNLWYRGKIASVSKSKCMVKFQSKNKNSDDLQDTVLEHILPLEHSGSNSDGDSGSDSDVQVVENDVDAESNFSQSKKHHEDLINQSLMVTPEGRLGEWEKHTKGIGSKLMQKMGYIVGTGLGKDGSGITKPVSALVLPQGKSLDFCMNLKEEFNNPHLFHADKMNKNVNTKGKRKKGRRFEKAKQQTKLPREQWNLEDFIIRSFSYTGSDVRVKETQFLRDKLKVASIKDVNVADYIIEERRKLRFKSKEKIKAAIQRLEEKHADPKALYKKLAQREAELNRLQVYWKIVQNELNMRKNNKEMAVF